MQNIEKHLLVLNELQKFLVQFVGDMREKLVEFNQRISQLSETGVNVQIAENYEANFCIQTIQHLQILIANITDNDLPYINTQISQFELTSIWRDTTGNIVAKKIGDRIWDNFGNWLYEIRGDRIYDTSGNWRFELRGEDRIYDTAGNWRYELRGDRIYDTSGNWLGLEY